MPAPEEGLDLLKALADNPLLTYAPDERPEAGIAFDLQSDFRPSGDQPQAIAELIEGVGAARASRCCSASPARARPSPWRTSLRRCRSRR